MSNSLISLLRRVTVPLSLTFVAAAVCVSCSSTSNGTPPEDTGGVSLGSLPGSPSVSVPSASIPELPSTSGGGFGTGAGSDGFCKDFDPSDLSSLGSSGDLSATLKFWDRIADDAPSEIKGDAEAIRDYLHGAVSGNVDPSDASKLSDAAQHIGQYYAQNCLSS